MLKRNEIADVSSCLNSAADDEPIFTLRANDELAAATVRAWAQRYYVAKSEQLGGMTQRQRRKYEEALSLASLMDQWRENRGA